MVKKLFLIFGILFLITLVSAETQTWNGQYHTDGTWNEGTYSFNFTIYNATTGGTICYSNTTSIITDEVGYWRTYQYNVLSSCPDASVDYYLNINIAGTDQTPRRFLKHLKYADTSGIVNFTENVNFEKNISISGTIESNLTPSLNDTYSLGTPDLLWKDIHLGPGSIYLGNYILDVFSGNFRIRNETTDIMLFNASINEMMFTTNTRTLGFSRGESPIKFEDGAQFFDEDGSKEFSIYHAHGNEYWRNVSGIFNHSTVFEVNEKENPYGMEFVVWDVPAQKAPLVINFGAEGRATTFGRSVKIGRTNHALDENYTKCDTLACNATDASDLEVEGSILAGRNITANYFIGDGSQLTGISTTPNIIIESTGLIQGGALSINSGDNTLIDITAGSGQIVDSTTDPDNPVLTSITWTAKTGYNLATTASAGDVVAIFLSLNSSGDVVERLELPTPEERRDTIDLGIAGRNDTNHITFAGSGPLSIIHNPTSQLQDFFQAWGSFNVEGNQIQPNAVDDLQIKKLAGSVFRNGANFQTDGKNPHIADLAEQAPANFNYKLSDGTDVTFSAYIDPDSYDDGTSTLATVPNNKWTVQYVTVFASGLVEILYGQEVFDTESDAVTALSTIDFTIPTDSKGAVPLSYLVLQQSDTILPEDRFYRISRIGTGGTGGTTYSAGTGIEISNSLISLNTTYTDTLYLAIGYTSLSNFTDDILWTSGFNATGDNRWGGGADTHVAGTGYLYNDSTTMYLNETQLNENTISVTGWDDGVGPLSIKWGGLTTASGNRATAWGDETNASQFRSTAWGYKTLSSGIDSTAWGWDTSATGQQSTAWGENTMSSGSESTAWGYGTIASNNQATAWGLSTIASGAYSTAFGRNINVSGENSVGIGLNDTAQTLTQANTMAIMGGNVGIGTTSPSAKFEVNGTVKIEDDLNMTSNNITSVDCITFISGGKICNSP